MKLTKTMKNKLEKVAKRIADLTEANAHGEAIAQAAMSFSTLYAVAGMDGAGHNPYRIAEGFLWEINAEHSRLGTLPCRLGSLRYAIGKAVFELARQDFPEAAAILEKGF